jgi:hypothetical protein
MSYNKGVVPAEPDQMANQLIPPAELAANDLGNLSPSQRIAVWLAMLGDGHKLVMAGLEREHGPGRRAHDAYRRWYAEQMDEHDQAMARMVARLKKRRTTHAS